MATSANAADASRTTRRTERAPSGGWRTIAAKEFADHVASLRFIVLLVVIAIAAVIPMYFISSDITGSAPQLSGQPALFLALFVVGSSTLGGVTTVAFAGLLVPLVGIAFGFDGINSERSQGTLSRLLSQPIHRDDVINGKFAAGIAVIAVMLGALVILVSGLGIVRLGIIPGVEEIVRVASWWLTTILYASFWLAFALLLSVLIRGAASAALVGFGTWLGLSLFGQFLLPLLADALFPATTTTLGGLQYTSTQASEILLRLSPDVLYQDITKALLNPTVNTVFGSYGNVGQAISAAQQQVSLLSYDQSILLVWPQIVALVALTTAMFALAYVMFLRQEVRA